MAGYLSQLFNWAASAPVAPPSLEYSAEAYSPFHQGIRDTLVKLSRYSHPEDRWCRLDLDQLKERLKTSNPFMKDARGDTPLHFVVRTPFAAEAVQCAAIFLLLQAKHPVNEVTEQGHTALQYAERQKLQLVSALLVRSGGRAAETPEPPPKIVVEQEAPKGPINAPEPPPAGASTEASV